MILRPNDCFIKASCHCNSMKLFPLRRFSIALMVAVCSLAFVSSTVLAEPVDDYNAALVFYKQQRWDTAADEFGKFLKANPTHERAAAARLYEADSFIRQKDFTRARESFRSFVATYDDHPDLYIAMYRVGECSYFLNELDVASKELTAFITKFPKHELVEWALEYRGETEFKRKEPKQAIATFQQIIDQFPDGQLASEARYMQAKAYSVSGDPTTAIATFREVVAANKGRKEDAQLDIGMLLFDQREFALALREFDATISQYPQAPQAKVAALNAGYSAYHLGEYQQAAARFNTIINDPQHGNDARFWLGLSHKSLGNYDLAIEALKPLAEQIEDAPLANKSRFHWGHAERLRDHYDVALLRFREVAEADLNGPLGADSLHLATESALLAGQIEEADRLDKLFSSTFPEHGLDQLQRMLQGRILLAQGDKRAADDGDAKLATPLYAAAEQIFAETAEQSKVPSTSRSAHIFLARAQDRQQAYDRVVETLAPIVDEIRLGDPATLAEYADALIVQSAALLKLNQNAETIAVTQLYLDKYPAGLHIAQANADASIAYARLDQPAEMQQSLDSLWELDSARPLAVDATYQAAEIFYARDQWSEAAILFAKVDEAGESRFQAAALSGMAYALNKVGKYEAAATAFDRFVQEHPEDVTLAASAAHMKGVSLQQAKKIPEAAEAYLAGWKQFAIADDVTEPTAVQQAAGNYAFLCARALGRVYRSQKKEAEGDIAFEHAYTQLRHQPEETQTADMSKLLLEWALMHYEADAFDRSSELFLKLVEECPKSEYVDDALLYVAENDYFAEEYDAAKPRLDGLIASNTTSDSVLHRAMELRIDIAEKTKDYDTVTAIADKMIAKFPNSEQAEYTTFRLGESQLQKGKVIDAVATLQSVYQSPKESVRTASWFPSVRLLLAEAYLRQKNYDGITEIAKLFQEQDPDSPQLYKIDEVVGKSLKNQAKFDDARIAFSRVIDSEHGRKTEAAAQSQLMIAETYLLQEKHDQALREYYKVYANYAFPDYQAPALFAAGQCDEVMRNWEGAIKSYELLLEEFAEHEYAKKAAERLPEVKKFAGE